VRSRERVIEEQSGVEVVLEVHQELQPRLLDGEVAGWGAILGGPLAPVLRAAALALAQPHVDAQGGDPEHVRQH